MNDPSPTAQTPLIQAQRSAPIQVKLPAQHWSNDHEQVLRFAPLAWLKLRLFLHAGDTEVGFFAISAEDDLLYIQDLAVPRQSTTVASVSFDDEAVADYFDNCADAEIPPSRCGRIWIHTHPGTSPSPSSVDEETFERVFGACDWAVMAIVARGGATYARLSFSAGPGGMVLIPMEVDWESLPHELLAREGTLDGLFTGWMDEYGRNVFPEVFFWPTAPVVSTETTPARPAYLDPRDILDELYDRQLLDQQFEDIYCDSIGVMP